MPASYVPGNSPSNPNTRSESLERGAKGAEILDHAKDGWTIQNHLADKVIKSGMAERLGKFAERGGYVLEPIKNGLDAAAEIAKGAPIGPTVAGAGIKTVSGLLAGAALGTAVGGPVGTVIGAPSAVHCQTNSGVTPINGLARAQRGCWTMRVALIHAT